MSADDRELLKLLLRDDTICHPLTLRLLARSARSKDWTLQELKEQLEKDGLSLSWRDGDTTIYLSKIYRQLYNYSQIPKECKQLAELFMFLPRSSYSIPFLKKWFPAIWTESSVGGLQTLVETGWLEQDQDGFSMHPFIAQCLRKKASTEKKLEPVLFRIRSELQNMIPGSFDIPNPSEMDQICGIVRYISKFMTGNVSREWFHALVYALYRADNTPQVQVTTFPMLDKFEKRCVDMDDSSKISALILRCNWLTAEQTEYTSVLDHQQESRTVSESLYLSLCLHAGYCAVFQHGNYALGEKFLCEVLNGPSDSGQIISAYFNLVHCCHAAGKSREALRWAEEGNQFTHAHPECGEVEICKLLSLLCQINCILQRKESAEALLPELHSRFADADDPSLRYYLLNALLYYESDYGNLEKALKYSEETLKIIEQLRGKGLDYYVCLGSHGLILKDLKRFEEALAGFDEALAYYRSLNQGYWIENLSHNAAVTCLDAKDPEKALSYLDESYAYAAELGGYSLAACHYSYSGAYAQLGAREKEYTHLQSAVPGLEAQLGADNPKCIKARQRLAELEAQNALMKNAEPSA